MKVDAEAIADRLRKSLMESTLADYLAIVRRGESFVEADWSKVRGLEFREALGERDQLVRETQFLEVDVHADDFEESVSLLFRCVCRARLMWE